MKQVQLPHLMSLLLLVFEFNKDCSNFRFTWLRFIRNRFISAWKSVGGSNRDLLVIDLFLCESQ